MDALRRNLHDQRGVSMLMALLLMLVALMVSAVVVAGASSAVSALRTDQKQEQAALTVTSAAELIRNSFLQEAAPTAVLVLPDCPNVPSHICHLYKL